MSAAGRLLAAACTGAALGSCAAVARTVREVGAPVLRRRMALALVGDDRLERVAAIRRLLRDDVSILANVSIHGARIDTPAGMSEFLMAGRVDLTHVVARSGKRLSRDEPPFRDHISVSSVRGTVRPQPFCDVRPFVGRWPL